jgi:hypothetical protein
LGDVFAKLAWNTGSNIIHPHAIQLVGSSVHYTALFTVTHETKSQNWSISVQGPEFDDDAIKLSLLNTKVIVCDV